jgi:hypothetical protein
MPNSNSINWQIESIRGSMFVNDQLDSNKLEAWLEEVSENSLSQVNRTPTSFVGTSRNPAGFLRVSWNANKLDVKLSSGEPRGAQTIAPLSDATSLFKLFVNRMPEICEPALVNRIALGLVLTYQVSSVEEGLELLKTRILSLNLPQSAGDFLYRVNIPCESLTSNGLNLNRLTTWSIPNQQIIEVQIRPDGTQNQRVVSENPLSIKLELDINTDKETPLDINTEEFSALIQEFQKIALDISNIGESFLLN